MLFKRTGQEELRKTLYCYASLLMQEGSISMYEVVENV